MKMYNYNFATDSELLVFVYQLKRLQLGYCLWLNV